MTQKTVGTLAKTKSKVLLPVIVAAILSFAARAENLNRGGHWVSAWSDAVHTPLPFPNLPASPVIENQTIRMVVRPTIGGERMRVRFSNAFGTTAIVIGAAHVALVSKGAQIIPQSDRILTFGGKGLVSIPPGAPMLSDPVDLKVPPFAELAISIYLPEKTPGSSIHFWAQHETYISGLGDFTAKPDISNATVRTSWYWLADVEVWGSERVAATIAFGDSITDGVGAKQGEYSDWPDLLAVRLAGEHGTTLAILNEGIGGNRILHDGAGISALARFNRDVLAQPGVVNLIILEGINDIGWPHMKPQTVPGGRTPKEGPFAGEVVSARDLIAGLQQVIERAHQHGIRVFGATLTPYEGADYYSEDGEAIRQAVNQWIRTSGAFDGVFDFDAAVRDPNHPARIRDDYQSGDHLHPSAAGYRAMAAAVDLSALTSFVAVRKNQ
ncbi:MAG TPA: SGNH/GDSL hydrolase family protein [Candidatus Acidoferrales bacterium]|nr:SGNH/GDSL hydrolase family protein [Candidatus Acidoferrales bacterium]